MASDRDQSKPHRPPTNGHPRVRNVALPFLELVRHAKLTLRRLRQRTAGAGANSGSGRPGSKEILPEDLGPVEPGSPPPDSEISPPSA